MWDREGMNPIDPYFEYFITPEKIGTKKSYNCKVIWKHYINTENGRCSLFSNMERLKLVNSTILKCLNINYILNQHLIEKVFPLNDLYELNGKSNMEIVQPMFDPPKVRKKFL